MLSYNRLCGIEFVLANVVRYYRLLTFIYAQQMLQGKAIIEVFSFAFVSNAFWIRDPSSGIFYFVCVLRDGNNGSS
jgi:hypothetical protein